MTKFKIEMKHGQDQRIVEADGFRSDTESGWLIFYSNPAVGGQRREYWRARLEHVVCVESGR